MTKGTLYGIGVGPGDPELLTLKAKRVLEECDVLLIPRKADDADSTALDIISTVVDTKGKTMIPQTFGMTKDTRMYYEYGRQSAESALKYMSEGKDVAFITLGDISTFSTFYYMQCHIMKEGYDVELIPGISSYCAGAARTKRPLIMGKESLAVIPSIGDIERIDRALDDFENIVIMKAGNNVGKICDLLNAHKVPLKDAIVISNLGMDDEYIGELNPDVKFGYFTTVLIRRSEE